MCLVVNYLCVGLEQLCSVAATWGDGGCALRACGRGQTVRRERAEPEGKSEHQSQRTQSTRGYSKDTLAPSVLLCLELACARSG